MSRRGACEKLTGHGSDDFKDSIWESRKEWGQDHTCPIVRVAEQEHGMRSTDVRDLEIC